LKDSYLQKISSIDNSGYGLLFKIFLLKDEEAKAADNIKDLVGNKFYTETMVVKLTIKDMPQPDI